MNERRLGRTGLSVSEIGYGAWGIGGCDVARRGGPGVAARRCNRAIDLGVNFIDTALGYGNGHSEQLVGKVVRERDERIVVASKIPPKNLSGRRRTGSTPTRRSRPTTSASAPSAGSPTSAWTCSTCSSSTSGATSGSAAASWLEGIQALSDEGKIRFFGVSINDLQPANAVKLIETGVVDTVQVIYNVFEQAPEDELLAACERNDVGVIARVPFDEGALTGRLTAGHRRSPRATSATSTSAASARWSRSTSACARSSTTSASRARSCRRWRCATCLSRPEVSTVIPGMRTRAQRRAQRRGRATGAGLPRRSTPARLLKAHRLRTTLPA